MNQTLSKTPMESGFKAIFPLVVVVFIGFFCVGIPLITLPGHVRETLGFGNLWVGIVLGLQSLATLLTRHYSGTVADLKGAKTAVFRGLVLALASGIVSLISLRLAGIESLGILLLSRVILGLGESLLITGALAWGVGLLGPAKAGRVMAWNGMAMYGAIAASAPLSSLIKIQLGFPFVMGTTILMALLAFLISLTIPAIPATGKERIPFYSVLNKVWRAGLGLSLSAVGFAALAGFAILYFKQQGWEYASLVMTIFGAAFILARIFFAHAPDKYGGKKVALVSIFIELIGQVLVWQALSPAVALVGSALTGFGYSLAFPAFGVEAIRKIEPQYKGVALGAYVAFFDLALGVTGPLAGLVATGFGYSSVYLFGVISCLLATLIAWRL
jgi:MFS family permease